MPSQKRNKTHGPDYILEQEKEEKKKKRKYSTNKSTDDFIKKLKESGDW